MLKPNIKTNSTNIVMTTKRHGLLGVVPTGLPGYAVKYLV